MKKKRGITIRFGPLGLSLLAAGITAVGVAAVSLAADSGTNSDNGTGSDTQTFQVPAPGGGVGAVSIAGPNLSAEDRQKLEDFRQCMEDNGAPAPHDPGKIDPSDGPPKPPSAADREKLQKAFEACKSKLPEDLQNAGPPMLEHGFKCGPPPGAPQQGQSQQGDSQERGQNKNQSNQAGTQSSGSAA